MSTMKTVYISEEAQKAIQENIIRNDISDNVETAILRNKTALGDNPAIPNIYSSPYLLKLVKSEFENAKDKLLKIKTIEDVDAGETDEALSKLMKKCQDLERPLRDSLERVCLNYVIDLFKIPNESIELNIGLCDKVDFSNTTIAVDQNEDSDDITFDDINDAMSIKDEVLKRRFIETLCMGCGLTVSKHIESYRSEIDKLNPELCRLYDKILSITDYLLFTKDIEIDDENKKAIGTVTVKMGAPDQVVKIEAQGTIFPVLLCETVRGLMELFASHGLPSDKERAKAVISKSEYLKAEPWDMRFGPILWEKFSNSFSDINFEDVPYLFKKVSSLNIDSFNSLMNEILANTRKGKTIMSNLCLSSKKESDYDRFVDKMEKKKLEKSLITDEFITEDEF